MLTGAALSSVSTDLEEKDAKAATKVQENGATAGDDSIEETVGAMAAQVQNAKDDTVAPALKRKGGPEDDDNDNSAAANKANKVVAAAAPAETPRSGAQVLLTKIFIVESWPGFNLTAHSSLEKATAYTTANKNSEIAKNGSTKVPKGQKYFEVEGAVALGDTLYAPLYFSDLTGRSIIGGVFRTKEESSSELRNTKKWRLSPQEKNGSGELYNLKVVLL